MKKTFFIGLILISLICLYAHSEDFVIGNYSYLKPHHSFFNDMANKMEEAHYNATIWEPSDDSNNSEKIDLLNGYGIDSFLYDQITNYDDNGEISAISLSNLSMGNFFQFDAEYDNLSTLNDSSNEYFYKFNITRPGSQLEETPDEYVWKCTPSPTSPDGGVIIDQLMYRWENASNNGNNSGINEGAFGYIGQEFEFANRNNFNDDSYLEGNKLYISFIYKIEDGADNQDCMKFGLKLKGQRPGEVEDSWQYVYLRNTKSPTEQNSMFTYKQAESVTFTEQADYTPIFVDVEPNSDINELVVYAGDDCVGGVKVDDEATVMVQAFIEDVPQDTPLTIVTINGSKSAKILENVVSYDNVLQVWDKIQELKVNNQDFYHVSMTKDATELLETQQIISTNYPNPFNPETNIQFNNPQAGEVTVDIYNLKGQLVKNLVNRDMDQGIHKIVWNGSNNANKSSASGVYFYKIRSGNATATKKIILMK